MGEVTYIDPKSKQMADTDGEQSGVIHCLMISLAEETLLLPNAAVAEVIGYIKPEPLESSPSWFMGRITWRERLVPLISIEAAMTTGENNNAEARGVRIAILNTLKGNTDVPYIGIISQGIPRLNVIRDESISTIETLPAGRQSVAEIVNVDGKELIIPDIDDLENRILNIHT